MRRKVARRRRPEGELLQKMVLAHRTEPQFSQPVRQIVMMLIVLGLTAANVLMVIGQTAEQIDALRETVEANVARSVETEARIGELVQVLATQRPEPVVPVDNALLERIATAQERVVQVLEARDADAGGLDAETRARLRSIDTQLLRILEDLAAGRQDLVTEIRQDIAGLAEAMRAVAARGRF